MTEESKQLLHLLRRANANLTSTKSDPGDPNINPVSSTSGSTLFTQERKKKTRAVEQKQGYKVTLPPSFGPAGP